MQLQKAMLNKEELQIISTAIYMIHCEHCEL